jgi:hypothetical protein
VRPTWSAMLLGIRDIRPAQPSGTAADADLVRNCE